MNLRTFVCVLAAACVPAAFAQMFTEVTEYGWGPGMNSSKPACADPDQDGLLDLIVGDSFGRLLHFRQTSAGSAAFRLVTAEFSGIEEGSYSTPNFTDIDGDGLLDLVVGDYEGTLRRFEQDAARSMVFVPVSQGFEGIDVGRYSVPCFTDLDQDGLLDMLVGELDGNINRYEQNAAGTAEFILVEDTLGGIDVGSRATPTVADLDGDGLLDLLCGENGGKIVHYEQKTPGSNEFDRISNDVRDVRGYEIRSAPCVTDFEGDGLLDLIVGEDSGNLKHFIQQGHSANEFSLVDFNVTGLYDLCKYSAPAVCDLDNNGKLDLFIGDQDEMLMRLEQENPKSERFKWIATGINPVLKLNFNYISPFFEDIDRDGLPDLIAGTNMGVLLHFEQDPSSPGAFILVSENFSGINVGGNSSPAFTDLDGDGLFDLVVGCEDGDLAHYEQDASGSYAFTLKSDSLAGIDVERWSSPCFTDLDGDGLIDMVVGRAGSLCHYEQAAAKSPDFSLVSENFNDIGVISIAKPAFADINGDGREDLLIGSEDGSIRYFRRNPETGIGENPHAVASRFELFPNYPNPFNPSTMIRFNVTEPCRVVLKVFDVRGREIAMPADGRFEAGSHSIRFDASGLPSGIYVYRIQMGNFKATRKMVVVD
jgi:hypothetical protein